MRAAADSFRDVVEAASSDDVDVNVNAGEDDNSRRQASQVVAWRALEAALVETIRDVAELLVSSQPKERRSSAAIRSDPVFEYFCEAAILPLLVDVARERPEDESPSHLGLHRVAWSPAVKAQVVRSVAYLVASLRDETALYFVLSQNSVNLLVRAFLPLHLWTDQAAAIILPPYVELLKALTLQLTASPHLLPCFLDATSEARGSEAMPLLAALLEAAAFGYGNSDSFVHATCLNLMVNLLNVPVVHQWISQQEPSIRPASRAVSSDDEKKEDDSPTPAERRTQPPQVRLASHLTLLFADRFERLVALTNGPVVNTVRSTALAGQLGIWNHQIELLNDVFECNVSAWNVRICEELLRGFVSTLLFALKGSSGSGMDGARQKLLGRGADVGVLDADSIPTPEARAQAATLALTLLFDRLEYLPLVRMLAVAVFHPHSTSVWDAAAAAPGAAIGGVTQEYEVTKSLNSIVEETSNSQASERGSLVLANSFRQELLNAIQGGYGEYRFIPTAMLVEAAINALERETLENLSILEPVEEGLSSFLERQHKLKSGVSIVAAKAAAVLTVQLLCKPFDPASVPSSVASERLRNSPLRVSLLGARDYFYKMAVESHHVLGVSEMFVDLVEDAVLALYRRTTIPVAGSSGPSVFAFVLSRYTCASFSNHETLIRKMRGVTPNDVETTRFYVEMALFYRACCRLVDRFLSQLHSCRDTAFETAPLQLQEPILDQMETAGELSGIFSELQEKPASGSVVDLRGRMAFPFSLPTGETRLSHTLGSSNQRRNVSGDHSLRTPSRMILVLDPTEVFLLEPVPRTNGTRGTVICCLPLLSVIAAASDHEWLHIAVKHSDVGHLIKNGNMALRFEAAGTCLIVRQYLERCRQLLRAEMLEKIKQLFRTSRDEEAGDEQDVNTSIDSVDQVCVIEPR